METDSPSPQVYKKTSDVSGYKPTVAPKSRALIATAEEINKKHACETASDSEIYDDIINSPSLQAHKKSGGYKPTLAPKSRAVLVAAEEIRKLKKKHACETASDSEIYDDIITLRDDLYDDTLLTVRGAEVTKRDPVKKVLFKQVSYEDIYDDILVYRLQESSATRNNPRLYKHPKVMQLVCHLPEKEGSKIDLDDIYDDILSGFRDSNSQPNSPRQISGDNSTPSTEDGLCSSSSTSYSAHRNESVSHEHQFDSKAEFEEVNTLHIHPEYKTSQSEPETWKDHILYENECFFRGKVFQYREDQQPEESHPPLKFQEKMTCEHKSTETVEANLSKYANIPLPLGRRRYDPLPEVREPSSASLSLNTFSHSSEGLDQYEQLPLYEDVDVYQKKKSEDDSYQDAVSVVIKALDLPDRIRQRSIRVTRGERKQLRKSIKKTMRKLKRTQRISGDSVVATPPVAGNETSPSHIPGAQDNCSSSSSEDEEGPIPFGKSRDVFDLLLQASGIERVPDRVLLPPQTREEEESNPHETTIEEKHSETNSHFDASQYSRWQDDPEIKLYQEAGIIPCRTQPEIAAEIEQLTTSAPSEPPPLPGIQRPRARVVTRTDRLVHKRFLMKRSQTLRPEQTSSPHTSNRRRSSMPTVPLEHVPQCSRKPSTKQHDTST